MKAKLKATGEVVEVEKRKITFADNSTEIYYRDIFDGDKYKENELIDMADDVVLTGADWQVYRMEVAKECMANMMSFVDGRHLNDDCSRLSAWAVKMAEHINRSLEGAERRMIWLKQKTSHTHWKSAKTDSPTRSIRNWSIR